MRAARLRANSTDCHDTDADVYPGAATSEAVLCTVDSDGDGWGDSQAPAPANTGSDCNDSDPAINPDATEVCDSVDNDCDGVDDEDDAADALTWYADSDQDSYGDASVTYKACSLPTGYVADTTDCDDSSSGTYPMPRTTIPQPTAQGFGHDGYGDATAVSPVVAGTDCDDASSSASGAAATTLPPPAPGMQTTMDMATQPPQAQ